MKLVGVLSTAALCLSLGIAVPAYAQEPHEQEEKGKPAQQEERKTQPEEKKAQQQQPAKQEEKNAHQEKNTKQEEKATLQQEKISKQQEKSAQERHKPKAEPVQQAQRRGGSRIPEDRYKANFGREHTFHVNQSDYSNGRRFAYGGYSFGFVDPWPSNWLYTQDVYVVEINGMYYLCNPMYPGVNLALSFTL